MPGLLAGPGELLFGVSTKRPKAATLWCRCGGDRACLEVAVLGVGQAWLDQRCEQVLPAGLLLGVPGAERFRTLSHPKGIYVQGRWNAIRLLHAPFGRRADTLLNFFLR